MSPPSDNVTRLLKRLVPRSRRILTGNFEICLWWIVVFFDGGSWSNLQPFLFSLVIGPHAFRRFIKRCFREQNFLSVACCQLPHDPPTIPAGSAHVFHGHTSERHC